VAFGLYPVLDGKKTQEAGYDIYKDVEFVKIAVPGDRNSLYFQPAEKSHKARFPKAYAAFKERASQPNEGMPIEQWAAINRSLAINLKTLHIHTVEALAAVHDGHVDRIGSNGRQLREKAIAWLADAKEGAATQKLATEKQALQDQIQALQAQMLELQNQLGKPQPQTQPTVSGHIDPTSSVEADVAAAARRPRRAN
jgi:hypothetical protein